MARSQTLLITALVLASLGQASSAPAAESTGTVSGRIHVSGGSAQDPVKAVFFLEDAPSTNAPARTDVEIAQKDLSFLPNFVVVAKGDQVQFPNHDKVFHNVFSLSRAARFDLGLYKEGTSKSVTFTREGTVDVFCNIHPQMVARIRVVPNRHYVVAAPDGTFRLTGVPAGTWHYVVWEPGGGESRGTVTVSAGGEAKLEVELAPKQATRQHLRKDGTPYGRYQ